MKKLIKMAISLLIVVLLLSSTIIATVAEDATTGEYVMPIDIVDFTTAEGFAKWQALADQWDERKLFVDEYTVHGMKGQVKATFIEDETDGNYARFQPKEPVATTDASTNDFRMTAELNVPITGEKQFIAFCYRITKGAHQSGNQIYFRDDTNSTGEFNASSGYWMAPSLKVDGTWQIKLIAIKSLSIKGNLKGIRIPIPGWENEYFDIKWIVCFNDDSKLAKNFDIEAYHAALNAPDPTAEPTPEVTEAPATEAPATETPAASGCGSIVSGFVAMSTLLGAGAIVLMKRKD